MSAQKQQESSKPRVRGRPFPKGVSGNPSGRRKGAVSIAGVLKAKLSRPDAERICGQLIKQAMAGDIQAVKLIFDRIDHPLTGPIALAVAQAGVVTGPTFNDGFAPTVNVKIVHNGRDDPRLSDPKLSPAELREIIGRLSIEPEPGPNGSAPSCAPATETPAHPAGEVLLKTAELPDSTKPAVPLAAVETVNDPEPDETAVLAAAGIVTAEAFLNSR
jgi:hypothetical protein